MSPYQLKTHDDFLGKYSPSCSRKPSDDPANKGHAQCTNIAAFFSFEGWLPRYDIIITCSFLLLHKLCIQFNCQRSKASATLQKHISDYFSDIFANFPPRGVDKRVQLSLKFGTFTAVWVRNWSQVLTWYKLFCRYKKTPYGSF